MRSQIETEGVTLAPVREIGAQNHDIGDWYSGPDELIEMARADLDLISDVAPQVVVTDLRVSAGLAVELSGVPDVSLMHFFAMSPYRAPRSYTDPFANPRALPARVATALRSRVRREHEGFARFSGVLGRSRGALGLPPRAGFPWEGSRVACTTTPLLDPSTTMPSHWRYVGPVTWSAKLDRAELPELCSGRPLVYVTQGSTGSADHLRRCVRELRDSDVDLFVATASLCDPEEFSDEPHVFARRYLPDAECSRRADLVVVHGGHLSTSQAHRAGTPVVVLPAGSDHWTWARRVERLGTGVAVRWPVAPGAVRRAVCRVLGQPSYGAAAEMVARHLARWPGPRLTADLVEEIAG
jgi:UDP:flavonoid glycosyltransferase YjiC (YdhE family)